MAGAFVHRLGRAGLLLYGLQIPGSSIGVITEEWRHACRIYGPWLSRDIGLFVPSAWRKNQQRVLLFDFKLRLPSGCCQPLQAVGCRGHGLAGVGPGWTRCWQRISRIGNNFLNGHAEFTELPSLLVLGQLNWRGSDPPGSLPG